MRTAKELIKVLGGASSVARILGIKEPSVFEWKKNNSIPEGRLIRLAPILEKKTNNEINRKNLFPDNYHEIWPELSETEN